MRLSVASSDYVPCGISERVAGRLVLDGDRSGTQRRAELLNASLRRRRSVGHIGWVPRVPARRLWVELVPRVHEEVATRGRAAPGDEPHQWLEVRRAIAQAAQMA